MEISEVRALAKEKMELHGIGHWKLSMVRSHTFAGRCRTRLFHKIPVWSNGEIELSINFMEVFPYEEVLDTILHEIAHALVPNNVKSHGPEWKHMATKIGAKPQRTVSADAPRPKTRYKGTCPNGHEYGRSRVTDNLYARNFYCTPCAKKNTTDRPYIEWVDTMTGRVLNPVSGADAKKVVPSVQVAAKAAPKPKANVSWKDRFDQGTTSFDDVW